MIDKAKKTVSVMATVTKAIGSVTDKKEIIDAVTNIAYISVTATLSGLQGVIQNSIDDVVDNIGTVIGTALCAFNPTIGNLFCPIYASATKSVEAGIHFGKAAAEGNMEEFEAGVKCLGTAMVTGMISISSDLDTKSQDVLSNYGLVMWQGFSNSASLASRPTRP